MDLLLNEWLMKFSHVKGESKIVKVKFDPCNGAQGTGNACVSWVGCTEHKLIAKGTSNSWVSCHCIWFFIGEDGPICLQVLQWHPVSLSSSVFGLPKFLIGDPRGPSLKDPLFPRPRNIVSIQCGFRNSAVRVSQGGGVARYMNSGYKYRNILIGYVQYDINTWCVSVSVCLLYYTVCVVDTWKTGLKRSLAAFLMATVTNSRWFVKYQLRQDSSPGAGVRGPESNPLAVSTSPTNLTVLSLNSVITLIL